jgi:hypothetical protein
MPTPPSSKGKRVVKVNASAYALLIEFMLHGIYTIPELAYMTGLHYITVIHYTGALHKAGACYIDHWEKDSRGRDSLKVYKIGKGTDAKRSKLTGAERTQAYRDKKRHHAILNILTGG